MQALWKFVYWITYVDFDIYKSMKLWESLLTICVCKIELLFLTLWILDMPNYLTNSLRYVLIPSPKKRFITLSQRRGAGEKRWKPGEKPLRVEKRTNNKLNPHMTPGPGIEPETHWWEGSALTTVPSLLPTYPGLCSWSAQVPQATNFCPIRWQIYASIVFYYIHPTID